MSKSMEALVSVVFKNGTIEAEVASSALQHSIGLMGRKALPEGGGMLFVFPYSLRTALWTFGMRFAIDIIFLDRDKKVTEIRANCVPWRSLIFPRDKFRYVLEVRAGTAERFPIHVGDGAEF